MPEIEFDPVDDISTGAVGLPGERTFFIQAEKDGQILSVLVEKEQVAVLSERLSQLLDQIAERFPFDEGEISPTAGVLGSDPVPLFRAMAIGIGFDPGRGMVLLELHENSVAEEEEEEEEEEEARSGDEEAGYLARLYLTPDQARAIATRGVEAVAAGRPPCPLCGGPIDPGGHVCPKLNGHASRAT